LKYNRLRKVNIAFAAAKAIFSIRIFADLPVK